MRLIGGVWLALVLERLRRRAQGMDGVGTTDGLEKGDVRVTIFEKEELVSF